MTRKQYKFIKKILEMIVCLIRCNRLWSKDGGSIMSRPEITLRSFYLWTFIYIKRANFLEIHGDDLDT